MNHRPLLFSLFIFFNFATVLLCDAKAQPVSGIELPALFSDNMVVQQGVPVPVWGTAKPSTSIRVTISQVSVQTQANANGKWITYLPAMGAGGPYMLSILSNDTIKVKGVMVGEVWFASGQSNMNFTIDRPVNHSEQTIATANYPSIREFKVQTASSRTPLEKMKGSWKVCTPENVRKFSAVAYFFARQLHLDKNVPVGIIHCSYSGTPIEAWISAGHLSTHPDFRDTVQAIARDTTDWAILDAYAAKVDSLRNAIVNIADNGVKQGAQQVNFNESTWKRIDYPLKASRMEVPSYSLVWMRKSVMIPHPPRGKDLFVNLGTVIKRDITYFNGVIIGRGDIEGPRLYRVPTNLIKKGKNVLAVRVLNEWGNGRLGNFEEEPLLYSSDSSLQISLKGDWKYNGNLEPDLPIAASNKNQPTGLFNAMVQPVTPYAIKGIVWYQGESNSGRPQQYKSLFPLLLADWRIHFKQGNLPFLFVQLPNYLPGGSKWAEMREAQAELLRFPTTGMAVTIDVGDANNLHPDNKEPVSLRLYEAAKKIAYADTLVTLGPLLKEVVVKGDSMYLHFNSVAGGLAVKGNKLNGFAIAGEDKNFQKAEARLLNDSTIILYASQISKPIAVRYGWMNEMHCNLYDGKGMPCPPFRTDNW